MRFYAVALYSVCLQTNEIKFGWSEDEDLGAVIIDILEEEDNIKKVRDIVKSKYGKIDVETVSKYYNDGEIVVSKPIIAYAQ